MGKVVEDSFSPVSAAKISFDVKVTVKSNWKEILGTKSANDLVFISSVTVNNGLPTGYYNSPALSDDELKDDAKVKEVLETLGTQLSNRLIFR